MKGSAQDIVNFTSRIDQAFESIEQKIDTDQKLSFHRKNNLLPTRPKANVLHHGIPTVEFYPVVYHYIYSVLPLKLSIGPAILDAVFSFLLNSPDMHSAGEYSWLMQMGNLCLAKHGPKDAAFPYYHWALAFYQKSAEKEGYTLVLSKMIGDLYEKGHPAFDNGHYKSVAFPKDYLKALECYQKAASQKDIDRIYDVIHDTSFSDTLDDQERLKLNQFFILNACATGNLDRLKALFKDESIKVQGIVNDQGKTLVNIVANGALKKEAKIEILSFLLRHGALPTDPKDANLQQTVSQFVNIAAIHSDCLNESRERTQKLNADLQQSQALVLTTNGQVQSLQRTATEQHEMMVAMAQEMMIVRQQLQLMQEQMAQVARIPGFREMLHCLPQRQAGLLLAPAVVDADVDATIIRPDTQ